MRRRAGAGGAAAWGCALKPVPRSILQQAVEGGCCPNSSMECVEDSEGTVARESAKFIHPRLAASGRAWIGRGIRLWDVLSCLLGRSVGTTLVTENRQSQKQISPFSICRKNWRLISCMIWRGLFSCSCKPGWEDYGDCGVTGHFTHSRFLHTAWAFLPPWHTAVKWKFNNSVINGTYVKTPKSKPNHWKKPSRSVSYLLQVFWNNSFKYYGKYISFSLLRFSLWFDSMNTTGCEEIDRCGLSFCRLTKEQFWTFKGKFSMSANAVLPPDLCGAIPQTSFEHQILPH